MKKLKVMISPLLFLSLCSCESLPENTMDVTDLLGIQEFETIQAFILKRGDRRTYSSMYNDNPHYDFQAFQAYLNPETGQGNINCDPQRSNFNVIVFQNFDDPDSIYHHLRIVRPGDLQRQDISTEKGLEENRVYLHLLGHDYEGSPAEMKQRLREFYLKKIREEIGSASDRNSA